MVKHLSLFWVALNWSQSAKSDNPPPKDTMHETQIFPQFHSGEEVFSVSISLKADSGFLPVWLPTDFRQKCTSPAQGQGVWHIRLSTNTLVVFWLLPFQLCASVHQTIVSGTGHFIVFAQKTSILGVSTECGSIG